MEPTEKRRDLFQFIRSTMRWAAMYPLKLDCRLLPHCICALGQSIEWVIELFLYLVCIHIVILYGCTMYLNYHSGDLELFVNCFLQTIIYIWTIGMKVYFRRMRPQLLEQLVDSINADYRTRSAIGFTFVSMDQCLAVANKFIKTYVYFCFSGAIFWLMVPIAYGNRSLPLTCWYPFDYKQPFIYETIYFLQSVGQIQVAAAFSASSGFHTVLAILISGQYDVLLCSLKNILATVSVGMRYNKNELSNLRQLYEFTEPEVNQYYCTIEKISDIDTLVHTIERQSNLMPHSQKFRYNFRNAFKKCIEHHWFILDCLRKMESFYSPIWFLKTGEVVFLMCLVAFVSVKTTTADSSIMKVISLGQYLLLVALEFFIICYFGEIIHFNSQRCGEALLRSPWNLHMREIKNDFRIFLLNAYRPFHLTAGKIFPLDIELFRMIITTAFSFLTLLQNMDIGYEEVAGTG